MRAAQTELFGPRFKTPAALPTIRARYVRASRLAWRAHLRGDDAELARWAFAAMVLSGRAGA